MQRDDSKIPNLIWYQNQTKVLWKQVPSLLKIKSIESLIQIKNDAFKSVDCSDEYRLAFRQIELP